MKQQNFQHIIAWSVFVLSLSVYFLTLEPTVSLWDCGEFISSAYRLENTHPPGAPLYMLLGRLFSLLAPDSSSVALYINALSAVASAFTVFFLFKIIYLFLSKQISVTDKKQTNFALSVSTAGALIFAFTDSFWFSALEAEVYALSVFFTALTLWLMLKYESEQDSNYAVRYLILVAFLTGLSVGVHLLNLLVIPAFVLIYHFKNHTVNFKSVLKFFFIGIFALFFVQYIMLKGSVKLAGFFELFFVNTLGLPFHSGLIFFLILIFGTIIFALFYTYKKRLPLLHHIILMFGMILIGFSSYFTVLIRANANPPVNENNPNNIFALETYLNRDQYGTKPLFYGANFMAEYASDKNGMRLKTYPYKYIKDSTTYKRIRKKIPKYHYKNGRTIFPRMHSRNPSHIKSYRLWGGIPPDAEELTFKQNIRFFLTYQLGQMYFRYLMWNFSGRQNDILGHGHFQKGNFISGFEELDKYMIGRENTQRKSDKSRNTYYILPFLFGIIGIISILRKAKKDFIILLTLFIFTGLAVVVFLNQEPYQARERDYAYVGSFMIFIVWIAFGLFAFFNFLSKFIYRNQQIREQITSGIFMIILFILPAQMLYQNYDDHNRAGRTIIRDAAHDLLASCAPNAILFVNADNDTFPLWYMQEVEGYRTDVRVINMSLLNAEWYINSLRKKAYLSDALKLTLSSDKYEESKREIVHIYSDISKVKQFKMQTVKDDYVMLPDILKFIASDADSSKIISGKTITYYTPSRKFALKINNHNLLKTTQFSALEQSKFQDYIYWDIKSDFLYKSNLAVLDITASNPLRPIYFSRTIEKRDFIGLKPYCRQEGMLYHLVSFRTDSSEFALNPDVQYNLLMSEFAYQKTNNTVLVNYDIRRFLRMIELKDIYTETAKSLIQAGKKAQAEAVLDRLLQIFPPKQFVYNDNFIDIAKLYEKIGAFSKSDKLNRQIQHNLKTELNYINRQEEPFRHFLAGRKEKISTFLLH